MRWREDAARADIEARKSPAQREKEAEDRIKAAIARRDNSHQNYFGVTKRANPVDFGVSLGREDKLYGDARKIQNSATKVKSLRKSNSEDRLKTLRKQNIDNQKKFYDRWRDEKSS